MTDPDITVVHDLDTGRVTEFEHCDDPDCTEPHHADCCTDDDCPGCSVVWKDEIDRKQVEWHEFNGYRLAGHNVDERIVVWARYDDDRASVHVVIDSRLEHIYVMPAHRVQETAEAHLSQKRHGAYSPAGLSEALTLQYGDGDNQSAPILCVPASGQGPEYHVAEVTHRGPQVVLELAVVLDDPF